MKVHQLLEEIRPLLLDLIKQRLDKGERVRLDFKWSEAENALKYRGYITDIRGNTLHSMHTFDSGRAEFERFTLPLDADDRLTLKKGKDGTWLVKKI